MYVRRTKAKSLRVPLKWNPTETFSFAGQIGAVIAGLLALIAALHFGRPILVPISLGVVIGLMFGPLADVIEKRGLKPSWSAAIVMLTFLFISLAGLAAFAVPLSMWMELLPTIWEKLRDTISDWEGVISSIGSVQEELRSLTGAEQRINVEVDDSTSASDLAFIAPALIGQLAVFLGSLYFFVATRHQIRIAILGLCMNRRLRWRVAHVFRDAEQLVSRYLLSITAINIGLGTAVAIAMAIIGVPSPILWGLMAALFNYIVYIGPACMAIILFGVGLATFDSTGMILLPPLVFLFLNFIEAQFVTPIVLGRSLTLNPFVIFLAVVFWLWMWGPAGGFLAVPFLLIVSATLDNVIPKSVQQTARSKTMARVGAAKSKKAA